MYGRMQLADYVVSYALHLNNRCLRVIGTATEPLAAKDLQDLCLQTERLMALWQLLHWSVGKAPYRAAAARLRLSRAIISGAMGQGSDGLALAAARGGEQLLAATNRARSDNVSGDIGQPVDAKGRRAVEAVVQMLAAEHPFVALPELGAQAVDELSGLFEQESEVWRGNSMLRHVSDDDLIDHGFGRAFDKGQRACRQLLESAGAASKDGPSGKVLLRAHRWVRHGVHQMELLRPGLSDTSKARRWYLQRLLANLTRQLEADHFQRAAMAAAARQEAEGPGDAKAPGHAKMSGKLQMRLQDLVGKRLRRLNAQCAKLAAGAYGERSELYRQRVREDVLRLGLEEIALLPLDVRGTRGDAS